MWIMAITIKGTTTKDSKTLFSDLEFFLDTLQDFEKIEKIDTRSVNVMFADERTALSAIRSFKCNSYYNKNFSVDFLNL